MKSNILSALCFGAAILASACTQPLQDDGTTVPMRDLTVTLMASNEGTHPPGDGTRVSYNDLHALWEESDVIHSFFVFEDGSAQDVQFHAMASGANVPFQGTIRIPEQDLNVTKVMAIYYGENLPDAPNLHYDKDHVQFRLPATQNGHINKHNIGAVTYTKPFTIKAIDEWFELPAELTFTPLFSRLDIVPQNFSSNITQIVLRMTDMTLKKNVPFNTHANILLTSGEITYINEDTDISEVIRIVPDEQLTEYQVSIIPMSFPNAPCKLDVVTYTADNARYTASFAVNEFAIGTRYRITIDANKAVEDNITYLDASNFASAINNDLDGNFVMAEDIALSSVPEINGFSGSLDGDGHTIDISQASASASMNQGGIFNTTTGDASIKNLNVTGGDREITMAEGGFVVGRVGGNDIQATLTLENVHVTGNITASRISGASHLFAGGLVGFVPNQSAITANECSFSGDVYVNQDVSLWSSTKNSYVGGIVGSVETGQTGEFTISSSYKGSEMGNASSITNCRVYSATITNTKENSTSPPSSYIINSTEIYTGGIAGRCTGIIANCQVEDCTIKGVSGEDGSGRQAKPILGNDWYENTNNTDNTYENTSVNGTTLNGTYHAGQSSPIYINM